MQRHSDKRDMILSFLRGTKEHPSADWVYSQLKPSYPNISVATVYRNLSQLKAAGTIISLGDVLGQERFDANTAAHTHAVCRRCGRIVDAETVEMPEELALRLEKETGFDVMDGSFQFNGLCPECKRNEDKTELA